MDGDPAQLVMELLEAEGPAMPLVVLARRLDIPPTRLAPVLDELFDAGRVTPGRERGTVALVETPLEDGRFHRAAPATRTPR